MNDETFLEQHSHLIPIVLRSCYIFDFNPTYEDYWQIAYEALLRAYHQCPTAKEAYYFMAMKWRVQDEKYRQQKTTMQVGHWHEEYDTLFQSPVTLCEPTFLLHCAPELTSFQIQILDFYIHGQEPLQSFLDRHHCTRSHFYDERRQLITTLKNNL